MSKRVLIIIIAITVLLGVGILAVFLYSKNNTAREGEGVTLKDFFPFGSSSGTTPTEPTVPEGETPTSGGTTVSEIGKVYLLSKEPVAGATIFEKEVLKEVSNDETFAEIPPKTPSKPETEFIPIVRFVDQATGHIYEIKVSKSLDARKISNTTIPNVQEALFGFNGKNVILRYLRDDNTTIETFAGVLPDEVIGGDSTEEGSLDGVFMPQGISFMSLSPNLKNIFYIMPFGNGVAGSITELDGTKTKTVWTSPLREWLSDWANKDNITVTTKASGYAQGYSYTIPATGGKAMKKVMGGIYGLTTLTSPDNKKVLFSRSGDSSTAIFILNKDTGASTTLPIKTLSEKCVWTKDSLSLYCAVPQSIPEAVYPDNWYQGLTSFSDEIWKVSAKDGFTDLLVSPGSILNKNIDGINLKLDPKESRLIFTDKTSGLLIGYTI